MGLPKLAFAILLFFCLSFTFENGVCLAAGTSGSTKAISSKAVASTYTVVFHANGGKGTMAAQKIRYGTAQKLTASKFKRPGYVFAGWSKSKAGVLAYANGATVKNLAKNGQKVVLYAAWAKPKYAVSFQANGGKGTMKAQVFAYGKAARLAANKFTKSGYVFKGWAKTAALAKKGTVAYADKKAVKNLVRNGATVKLYAVWKKKSSGSSSSAQNNTSSYWRAQYVNYMYLYKFWMTKAELQQSHVSFTQQNAANSTSIMAGLAASSALQNYKLYLSYAQEWYTKAQIALRLANQLAAQGK